MKKKTLISIIVAVVVIAAIVVGIRLAQKPSPKEQVYKIGAILPLTGPAASFGQTNLRGIELAIKHLNQAGNGKRFELALEDSMSDPKSGVAAFKKLEQQGVKVIITSLSSVALALVPPADSAQILLFADVAHPKVTDSSALVFRHSQTAEQEAKLLANYLSSEGIKTIGLLWVNDDYGLTFQEAFQKNKGSITISSLENFEKTEMDFRNIVTKILSPKPEAVIVCGYGKPLGMAIKRLREAGFRGEILSTMGFAASPDAPSVAGESAKGTKYVDFAVNKDSPQYQKLESDYTAAYQSQMPTFVMLEYNTTILLGSAIRAVNYDPSKIANYLKSQKSFESAGEKMTITQKGDILPNLVIKNH